MENAVIYNMLKAAKPKIDLIELKEKSDNKAVAYGTKIIKGHMEWEQKDKAKIQAFKDGVDFILNTLIQ